MRKLMGEEEFDEFLSTSKGGSLVCFFADWCPHCVRYLPLFESHTPPLGLEFIEVDISDEEDPLWDRFGIEVVPSLVLFREGREVGRVDGILGRGLVKGDVERLRS